MSPVSPQRISPAFPDRTSTVAIVTAFHPEPGLANRLQGVLGQVARILIIDNGSDPAEQTEITALMDRGDVDVVWNHTNLGLAAALDRGLAWASDRRAAWALLLDQDSRAGPGIIAEAARVLAAAGSRPVAAVGAGIVSKDVATLADARDW